ncbi:hypothetical protein RYH70_04050 [Alloalcanivorax xenomutans]|uniref:ORC-CDC6 family AAA ATPase n=1 Tax=Alloalcanivorax xenomutans TaxID=1094342 RepID=UPI002934AAAE|nr:hypothetical protein [Alloalcanivorax xenomutans]WOD29236.1 hypothetical protein RYH70_04050 [Alloalcanivorax xenomutans]
MSLRSVIHKFSTARAEFHSTTQSVYGRFVVPPFIDIIDLVKIDHSMAIVGGRGCGKTTYVRYFSHWTQFDRNRTEIDPEAIKCVVFYWKPDTAYCRSLSQGWLSEDNARIFFYSLSAASLLYEIVGFLENAGYHYPEILNQLENSRDFWSKIKKISGEAFRSLSDLKEWLDEALYDIQINININDVSNTVKMHPKAVMDLILPVLVRDCSTLRDTRFKIFVDEFENLAEYQQKIINNFRKHSDAFLSWNVAHKRFAQLSNSTDGDEKLQHDNDYREYVLDESFKDEKEQKFFLCELLLLGLLGAGLECEIKGLDQKALGDRSRLALRSRVEYRNRVLEVAKRILPPVSNRYLAGIAIKISSVRKFTENALKKIKGLPHGHIEKMINDYPDVAIATVAISSQRSFLVHDLISFIESDYSASHKYSQRVQTYLVTALLNLNSRYSYITIPIYSGVDRFCRLSMFNIRHFFDLCYNTFKFFDDRDDEVLSLESFPSMSLDSMHKGAISSSSSIIKEIPTYTPMGLTLNALVNRLGGIFQVWQRGTNQSEPERTHFYILNDFGSLPANIKALIDQAKCWRVLVEYPATKDKNSNSSSGYEYQLNPIYAPYFGISYRKIRRIEFTESDFVKICFGDSSEYELIRNKHIEMSKSLLAKNDRSGGGQGALF